MGTLIKTEKLQYQILIFFFLVIPEKTCKTRAQEISQFNGCSVPKWLEDPANSHGEHIVNYTKLFETDCNKHDICYG